MARGKLRTEGRDWYLVLPNGDECNIDTGVRNNARNGLGLTDEDDGAELEAQIQTRYGGLSPRVVKIVSIIAPSPRLAQQEEREAAEAARVAEVKAAAARRAEAEAVAEQARYRRAGAGKDVEELSRVYRQHYTPQPQVNAYTFLPYALNPPQDRFDPPRHRTEPALQVDGTTPASDQRYSGMLELELHVRTPLCVFGSQQQVPAPHRFTSGQMRTGTPDPKKPHTRIEPLRDAGGHPTIPGSSLKGVTRSWLEAITSSERRSDEAPVAWRSTAIGKRRRLAIINLKNQDGSAATLRSREADRDGKPKRPPSGLTASIRPIESWDAGVAHIPKKQRLLARFEATLEQFNLEGKLRDGQPVTGKDGAKGFLKLGVSMQGEVSIHVGLSAGQQAPTIEIGEDTLQTWFAAHTDGGDQKRPKINPAFKQRKISVTPPDPTLLRDGDLVWYQLDDSGQISYLGRLRNGRWSELRPLAGKTPTGHESPEDPHQRSPAHRMFGFAQDRDLLSGRIRFSPAISPTTDPPTKSYTLRALSAPKLSSAGLYLDGEADHVAWTAPDDGTTWLRGTKVYWHTVPAQLEGIPTDARVIEEKKVDGKPARTHQNRTVTALTSGTFRTRIAFEDLSRLELGALLLATTLRFDESDRQVGWKLGIGRPVGLGSLENRLAALRLRDDAWQADPTAAGWRDATQEVEALLQEAREYFLPSEQDRQTFAFVADHFSLVDRTVGYPGLTTLFRRADGESPRQPNAAQVQDGKALNLAGR